MMGASAPAAPHGRGSSATHPMAGLAVSGFCGAKAKQTGQPCRRPAGWGTDHPREGRCKLHGGVYLKGRQNPAYRHGLYSRYADHDSEGVQAILARLDADKEIGDVSGEVLYLTARMIAWIEENRGSWSLEQFGSVSIILERLTHIKQRQQRLMQDRKALIAAVEVRAFLEAVCRIALGFIRDPRDHEAFTQQLLEVPLADAR